VEAGAPWDGGIELFYPKTGKTSGIVISEKNMGGDPVDALLVSEDKGYAILEVRSGARPATRLVAFRLREKKILKTILDPEAWTLSSLELTPDGNELWVADRSPKNPGIRIFDTQTDREITKEPIDVGLPPYSICFVP
jgi:hypothetical protein